MPDLTTLQLLLIVTALAVACVLLVCTLREMTRDKHRAMQEIMELHITNTRLNWEADMVRAELRTTCKLQGIPVPSCCRTDRSPRHG